MSIDKKSTVLLTLDMQNGIFGSIGEPANATKQPAKTAVDAARAAGLDLIHVGVGFEQGYPEVPDALYDGHMFKGIKGSGMFIKGDQASSFIPEVYKDGDTVFYKQRIGAFAQRSADSPHRNVKNGGLEHKLREMGKTHLVIFGVATSGIVLSTVRDAFDKDYKVTVIRDGCADRDPTTHDVLLSDKVFGWTAKMITADEFAKSLQ